MLAETPTREDMIKLLGKDLYAIWTRLCLAIVESYDMDRLWDAGGKNWKYEYKYRRAGKTLCALYAREERLGFLVILGKKEREKFEARKDMFSDNVRAAYDEATTYHDGKWIMFEPKSEASIDEYILLLSLKRRPNRG